MTIQKLIDKYTNLTKQNYETIIIAEVLNDLWQIKRQNALRNYKNRYSKIRNQ